jgi:hypothetical protein
VFVCVPSPAEDAGATRSRRDDAATGVRRRT